MFRGRSLHLLDQKGRISIPTRFREILKAGGDPRLVVTNSEDCLAAYPYEEWQRFEEKLSQFSQVDREIRSFKRFFISGACECSLDSQGRILIPPALREFAGLGKEVILAGQLKYFEVWDKLKLEEELKRAQQNLLALETKVATLGL
ncbi:MAG: division/cell wall cluster transcriptional repressor MraZ [Deltaproteobacteria bacterium]|nr:division/cell wall cluster transcriptional repressor MraZ [Deltaproteobacteria bacterium]